MDDYHGGLALPSTIACKVSSEAAGYVTTSAVARLDLPVEELASRILGACGKNQDRVARILARGSLVSGDSRYRWIPFEVPPEELAALLDRFPDHDPQRVFQRESCVLMAFRGQRGAIEITRESGRQKRLFRRKTFWNEALDLIQPLSPRCERYSYSDKADVFTVQLTVTALERLRRLGALLRFSALDAQIRSLRSGQVVLYARRE